MFWDRLQVIIFYVILVPFLHFFSFYTGALMYKKVFISVNESDFKKGKN